MAEYGYIASLSSRSSQLFFLAGEKDPVASEGAED